MLSSLRNALAVMTVIACTAPAWASPEGEYASAPPPPPLPATETAPPNRPTRSALPVPPPPPPPNWPGVRSTPRAPTKRNVDTQRPTIQPIVPQGLPPTAPATSPRTAPMAGRMAYPYGPVGAPRADQPATAPAYPLNNPPTTGAARDDAIRADKEEPVVGGEEMAFPYGGAGYQPPGWTPPHLRAKNDPANADESELSFTTVRDSIPAPIAPPGFPRNATTYAPDSCLPKISGPTRMTKRTFPRNLSPKPITTGCPPPCEPCKLGCWEPSDCRKTYIDGSISVLPNIGVGFGIGHVFRRTEYEDWGFEIQGVYQFLDDEDFANDGNPAAGDWYQLRVGVKTSSSPRARRHFTKRGGVVWFNANGVPNIIQQPGNYFGLYGGVGFETDISSSITVGPEISLMVAVDDDGKFANKPVPQLGWHVIWWPGGGKKLKRLPYGEIYAGVFASAVPGIGGGVQFGQVFSRTSLATYSFEILAGGQNTSTSMFFDESGKWASIRGGAKATFNPCKCAHWTARAGATWLRTTARNDFTSNTGDHVGAYLGIGYEWDIGNRLTTGPEASFSLVKPEQGSGVDLIPQLNWHLIFKF